MTDAPHDGDDGPRRTAEPAIDQPATQDGEWTQVAQRPNEPDEADGLTTTIVSAVADAEGVSPREVKRPPLYDVVDTAALERAFFQSETDTGDVRCLTEFEYRDYRVVVRSDGWVLVYERVDR